MESKKVNNINCLLKKCRLYVQLIGARPFIVSNYRNLGFCRLFKLVLIVTRNFLLDSVSAVKITFIVESVINVYMVRHYLTRAMCVTNCHESFYYLHFNNNYYFSIMMQLFYICLVQIYVTSAKI